jgi:hypothetical protein
VAERDGAGDARGWEDARGIVGRWIRRVDGVWRMQEGELEGGCRRLIMVEDKVSGEEVKSQSCE